MQVDQLLIVTGVLLFGLLLSLGVYSLVALVSEWNRHKVWRMAQQYRHQEAVDELYSQIWTGLKEDEVDAWDRVIWYLEEYQYPKDAITEAKLRHLLRLWYGRNVRYGEPVPPQFHSTLDHPGQPKFESPGQIAVGESKSAKHKSQL